MERVNEGRLTKKIYRARVNGLEEDRMMDGVGKFVEERCFSFEE